MSNKIYRIYPNFSFEVSAKNEKEAKKIAYTKLKNAVELTDGGFDFSVEYEVDEDNACCKCGKIIPDGYSMCQSCENERS